MESQPEFFAYIVECADGSYYTGWTNNLSERLQTHNSGQGSKYTRARRPVRLVASWTFESKQAAMSYEWHVKQMSRQRKQQLVAKFLALSAADGESALG